MISKLHGLTYCVLTLALQFASVVKISATDSLYVHTPQIPILLDRTNNLLCEIRLNARSGEIFDGITVALDPAATNGIAALRLFYGGTEARGPTATFRGICLPAYARRIRRIQCSKVRCATLPPKRYSLRDSSCLRG